MATNDKTRRLQYQVRPDQAARLASAHGEAGGSWARVAWDALEVWSRLTRIERMLLAAEASVRAGYGDSRAGCVITPRPGHWLSSVPLPDGADLSGRVVPHADNRDDVEAATVWDREPDDAPVSDPMLIADERLITGDER